MTTTEDAQAYWEFLLEAYEAEKAYREINERDRRRLTNKTAFRRGAAREALKAHLQGGPDDPL